MKEYIKLTRDRSDSEAISMETINTYALLGWRVISVQWGHVYRDSGMRIDAVMFERDKPEGK